jgi:hypothetical protein
MIQDGDPGIPRKPPPRGRRQVAHTTVGWFARLRNGELKLESKQGNRWRLDQVSILAGSWGSIDNIEGVSKLPRPREYDKDGKVTVPGDRVVIDFVDGDGSKPLVRGGVRGLKPDDFLPRTDTKDEGVDYNRLAGRLAPRDADGNIVGFVEWEAAHSNTAALRLSLIPASEAEGVPPGARTFVSMDMDGTIQIATASGETLLLKDGQVALLTKQSKPEAPPPSSSPGPSSSATASRPPPSRSSSRRTSWATSLS